MAGGGHARRSESGAGDKSRPVVSAAGRGARRVGSVKAIFMSEKIEDSIEYRMLTAQGIP